MTGETKALNDAWEKKLLSDRERERERKRERERFRKDPDPRSFPLRILLGLKKFSCPFLTEVAHSYLCPPLFSSSSSSPMLLFPGTSFPANVLRVEYWTEDAEPLCGNRLAVCVLHIACSQRLSKTTTTSLACLQNARTA